MESRRGPRVPLIIVALAVAAGCVTGCVTVAPASGPGAVPGAGAPPAPTGVRTGLPGPAAEALPLGTLPEVLQDADPVPEEPPDALQGPPLLRGRPRPRRRPPGRAAG